MLWFNRCGGMREHEPDNEQQIAAYVEWHKNANMSS